MARVGQFELEAHLGDAVVARVRAAGHDVHVLFGQRVGDVAQEPTAIECHHFHAGPENASGGRTVPLDIDESGRLIVGQ